MYSFSYLEPVCCSTSSSNCSNFLTCIQISQEADKVIWYSHLLKNFPQFVVTHTVKGFSIVNEAEVLVWNSLAFSMIQWMLAIWSLVLLLFLNPARTSGSSWFMNCWIPSLENFNNLELLQNWEQKNVLHNYVQIKELVSQWAPYSLSLKHNMIYEVPVSAKHCEVVQHHHPYHT